MLEWVRRWAVVPAAVSADFTALFSSLLQMMRPDRLFSQKLPCRSTDTAAAWSRERTLAGPQPLAPRRQRGWWSSCTTGKEGRGRHGYCSPFCLLQNFSFRHAGVTPIYVSPGVVLIGCFLALSCNNFVDRTNAAELLLKSSKKRRQTEILKETLTLGLVSFITWCHGITFCSANLKDRHWLEK